MGVQNLSKPVKICQSYWQKFASTFLCPTVYSIRYFFSDSNWCDLRSGVMTQHSF